MICKDRLPGSFFQFSANHIPRKPAQFVQAILPKIEFVFSTDACAVPPGEAPLTFCRLSFCKSLDFSTFLFIQLHTICRGLAVMELFKKKIICAGNAMAGNYAAGRRDAVFAFTEPTP